MPPSTNGATAHQPQAASAADFRAFTDSPALLPLPDSGLTVEVRRVHVSDLAAAGEIPNELAGVAMRVLGADGAAPLPRTLQESARETRDVVNAVCIAALRSPRMVHDGDEVPEGAIPCAAMPWADREHVFNYVCRLGGARPLARFPERPAGGVAPVANVPELGDAAE